MILFFLYSTKILVYVNTYLHYQCLRYHKREFNVCVRGKSRKIFVPHKIFLRETRFIGRVYIRGTGVRPKNRKGAIYPARDPLFPRGRSTFVYNPRDDDSGALCGSTWRSGTKKCRKTRVADTRGRRNARERRACVRCRQDDGEVAGVARGRSRGSRRGGRGRWAWYQGRGKR